MKNSTPEPGMRKRASDERNPPKLSSNATIRSLYGNPNVFKVLDASGGMVPDVSVLGVA